MSDNSSTTLTMNRQRNDDIAYFISFCIELYKNANDLKGAEVSNIFNTTGLTEFLAENFESVHTQSPQWILEEINEFLSTHNTQ